MSASNVTPPESPTAHTARSYTAEIAICWTIVSIPLAYGVFNTIKNTLPLFGAE